MSTAVNTNYFATAHETFSDTLSSSILAAATTVPINNLSEYTNGDIVVLTVEPGTANEATFVGEKSGNEVINVVWTEGNLAVGHSSGATVIDYDSATHFNNLSKGVRQFANQNGTLKTQPVRDALALGATAVNGWEVFPYTVSVVSGYNKGSREFDATVANADVRSLLSEGMKFRLQRGTAAPTQCLDLEASSSQYAADSSVSGVSFTDDFTCEAWINLESYGNPGMILSRMNAAITQGWFFRVNSTGQIGIYGYTTAGGTNRGYDTYEAIPLNQWVHVAATLDMSGNAATIYINGVSVSLQSGGSTATALIQAGDLQIGNLTGAAQYFDGKIADVRLWSTIRTALQVRDNMNQQLTGSETGLVGYWKLSGNLNDSTVNANNMTGSGGAAATASDHPFNDLEYAYIMKISYSAPNSTITLFTGTDHTIPNMTLSAPYYSVQASPYGFPTSRHKWRITVPMLADVNNGASVANQYYNVAGLSIAKPAGDFTIKAYVTAQATTAGSIHGAGVALDTAAGNFATIRTAKAVAPYVNSTDARGSVVIEHEATDTAQQVYYVNIASLNDAGTALYVIGVSGSTKLVAECAHR